MGEDKIHGGVWRGRCKSEVKSAKELRITGGNDGDARGVQGCPI